MVHQRRKSDNKQGSSATRKEWPTVARQKEKRALLLAKSSRGVAVFDAHERLIDCNDSFRNFHNLPDNLGVEGTLFSDILNHQVDTGNFEGTDPQTYVASHFNTVRNAKLGTRIESLPDGRTVSVGHIPVESGGWITTLDDMSNIFAIKDELEHAGFYDRRTSLPNKRVLLKCIEDAYVNSWEEEYFAVHYLKITNLNDLSARLSEHGVHMLMKRVACRLRDSVRKEDLVAKVEGAEFAVIQQSMTEPDDGQAMATRLLTTLQMPYEVDGVTVLVEFVVGIALPNAENDCEKHMLESAREACDVAVHQTGQRYAYAKLEDPVALSA